ncbi:hypothetical protein SFUMM280S_08184 [Streptomyces fumanus]
MHLFAPSAQYCFDLLGIFAFALSGACLAVRKDFGLFAAVVVAEAAGLGGGLLRDLVLDVPPVAFTDPGYPTAALVTALAVYFGRPPDEESWAVRLLDAMALGLFSVTGTIKALQHGMGPVPAAALGVATAVGGGVLASVVSRELPTLMRWNADLYAVPAMAGAGGVSLLHGTGTLDVRTAMSAAAAACVLRLLATHFRWRLPRSSMWRSRAPHRNGGFGVPPTAGGHRPVPGSGEDTLRLTVPRNVFAEGPRP